MNSPFLASSIKKSPIPAPGIFEGAIFTFLGLMEGFGTGPLRLGLGRFDGVVEGGVARAAALAFASSVRVLACTLLVLYRLTAGVFGLVEPLNDGCTESAFIGVVVVVGVVLVGVDSNAGCEGVGSRVLSPKLSSLLSLLEKSAAFACSQVGTLRRAITLTLCRASAGVFFIFF